MQDPTDFSSPAEGFWRANTWSDARTPLLYQILEHAQEQDVGFEKAMLAAWKASIKRTTQQITNPLERAKQEVPKQVNQLIAWGMLVGEGCAFSEGPDLYDKLFRMIDVKRAAVVSLNYDLLAEEAIARSVVGLFDGAGYYYPGPRTLAQINSGVPVFKIHGSVNFLRLFNTAASATLKTVREHKRCGPPYTLSGPHRRGDSQREYVPIDRASTIIELKRAGNVDEAILAVYCAGKPVVSNYPALRDARRKCLEAIEANPHARVTAIGVRWPTTKDDAYASKILKALARLRGPRIYSAYKDPRTLRCARQAGFDAKEMNFKQLLADGCLN